MQKREIERSFQRAEKEIDQINTAADKFIDGVVRELERLFIRCARSRELERVKGRLYSENRARPILKTGLEYDGRRIFIGKDSDFVYWDWTSVGRLREPIVLRLSPETNRMAWLNLFRSEELKKYLIRNGTRKGRPKARK